MKNFETIEKWIIEHPLLSQAVFPALLVFAAVGTLALGMFIISTTLG